MGFIPNVFKMLIIDSKNNVYATDTLQESNLQLETETNDVRGGDANGLLGILHGSKEFTITANDPNWNFEVLALHMGEDIVTGTGVAYAMPDYYELALGEAPATHEVELPHVAIDGTVKVEKEDGTPVTGITLSGKKLVIADPNVKEGEYVKVVTYKYNTPAGTKTTEISSDKFPKDVKIILETKEFDFDESPIQLIQFQYDRVKPAANFTMNIGTAREAVAQERSFRVMKPRRSTKLGRMMQIPIEDTTP
ncbi:hypothetical protein [Priestia flexa]|uniref:hypothetical protein n=1 Tax=Priestia flexa TaxID=86664 RepID=UPI0004740AC3|nr:hypothetical protein [Priestia flexa]